MYKRIIFMLSLTLLLQGCPIEGDDGNRGAAGLSCWDLNEDGSKTFPSEDTNLDGEINVRDCRVSSAPAPTTLFIDPATETVVNQHTRVAYSSGESQGNVIELSTATFDAYTLATLNGSYADLEVYVTDPIKDPCGIWKWVRVETGVGDGVYRLQAENAIGFSTSHHPVVVTDSGGVTHHGKDACAYRCLGESSCVAAMYRREAAFDSNTLICTLAYDAGFDVADNFELIALYTSDRGWLTANITLAGPEDNGVISVCDAAP